jgi:hypothetical protein
MDAPATNSTRNWAGVTVPAFLMLALLADGLSRFMSLDPFTIRAWEAMTRNVFTEGGIPLEPSKHYENDGCYGDLAALSNRHELREYHREVFTTDRFGYRNRQEFSRQNPPDAILVGTSFSVGCGVSDDETLAVRLAARTGQRIYNGAGSPPSPDQATAVARQFGLSRGTVFYELLEINRLPPRPPPLSRSSRLCLDHLGAACLRLKGWMSVSPVQVLSRRAYRGLEDDRWLPNTPAALSVPNLVDGRPMLFSEGRAVTCPEVTAEQARDYFRWFRDGLGGLQLFVMLVPSKFSVYGGLSDMWLDPVATSPDTCFATMRRALAALQIPYVDLTEPLRAAARDALARHQMLYFRGDTHWNPAGIDAAAQITADAWSATGRGRGN